MEKKVKFHVISKINYSSFVILSKTNSFTSVSKYVILTVGKHMNPLPILFPKSPTSALPIFAPELWSMFKNHFKHIYDKEN